MAFDGSTCSRGWQWRIIKTVCKIRTRLSFMAMAISSTTVTRVTWATHHYDKPSNSQLWVWMALLKNTSQSISQRNVHFCIIFINRILVFFQLLLDDPSYCQGWIFCHMWLTLLVLPFSRKLNFGNRFTNKKVKRGACRKLANIFTPGSTCRKF